MKIIIFALLIFSQCLFVNCSMMDVLNQIAGCVSKAFNNVSEKVKQLFMTTYLENRVASVQDHLFVDRPLNHNMEHAFSDYTKNQGLNSQETETDSDSVKNSALLLATPQLALWHGRDMESHVIQTKDGYFLTVHRITANPDLQANRTVLLHHGLLGSSTDWILLGPTKSLPYILSDAGFDVWITNARGNYYSRGHLSKKTECSAYWKFSWQEMGEFDLPAVIDYIRLTKNLTESINFIGHSMGATALLVLLSSAPKYNEYLRMGVLLAPLVYMNNIVGPLKVMTGMSEEVVKLMGEGEFLPSRKVPSWLANKYCEGPIIFCANPLLFLSGIREDQRWNASFIARLLYHVPAGGSTNTLLHYMQVSHSGKFHRYNQPESEFSLNNITLPIALFSSGDDWLASTPDVLKLYFSLINPIDHHILRNKNITHTDFVWGTDASDLVFGRVLEYLEKGLEWNMMKQNEVL